MKHHFKASIYKKGINACVDVPLRITKKMTPVKGFIKITGQINDFKFHQTLVPVKNGPYRLFVNLVMLKGASTAVGKRVEFLIEQESKTTTTEYPIPDLLSKKLNEHRLIKDFDELTPSRRKDILRYLGHIKTEDTLKKNVDKVINQLTNKRSEVRIP